MKRVRSMHHYKRIRGVCLILALVLLMGQLSGVVSAAKNEDIPSSEETEEILAKPLENETNEMSFESAESKDEEIGVTYDPQPQTKADVQAAIDAYTSKYLEKMATGGFLAAIAVEKPHWQYRVIDSLMPSGYNCQIVTGDIIFGENYYTFFPSASTLAADATAWDESTLKNAIASAPTDGTLYEIEIDLSFEITSAIVIPAGANISIYTTSGLPRRTIKQTADETRHFLLEGNLTLTNIVLDGEGSGGGVETAMIDNKIVTDTVFTMNSKAVIKNCYAFNGGGVLVVLGKFYMYDDAAIENCEAAKRAGGVQIRGSYFYMNGGNISYNTAYGDAGGVLIDEYMEGTGNLVPSTCTLTGKVLIEGNMATGVWVSPSGDEHSSGCGGGIYVASSGDFEIDGEVRIWKNKAISARNSNYGGGLYVSGRVGYSDSDTIPGKGWIDGEAEISENEAISGAGVMVESAYTLTLRKVKIYKNIAVVSGGGLWLFGGGSVDKKVYLAIENGAEIYDNSAYSGGGINAGANSEVNMSGGTIGKVDHYNVAASNGGGAYIAGKYTMTGGTVHYNKATANGGGMCVQSRGYLEVTGGSVICNEANNGGGVFLQSVNGAVKMSGGEIGNSSYPNTAFNNGGGVYVNDGSFTMEGGKISANEAVGNGGGCYVNNGVLTVTGGNITGNKAPNGHGGGIYTTKAGDGYTNLTVETAALFSGNTASVNYNPPDQDIVDTGIWPTITNYTSSLVAGTGTNRVLPVNNDDINVVTYTVDFYAPVSSDSLSTFLHYDVQQTVAQYCKAVKPADPVVTNADFIDWYETSGLINVYDFNSPIIEETNIYAKMVKTISFTFHKVDDETNAPLPKAEFILYKWNDENSSPGANAIVVAGSTDWNKVGETQISGDVDGLISFSGLTAGIYQLVEEKAPQGYELPAGQWRFTVTLSSVSGEYVLGSISSITEAGGEAPPDFAPALPGGSGDRTLPNKKTSYLSFTFTKVKAEDIKAPLAGAEFKLYIWKGNGTAPDVIENASITSGDWELVDTQTSADSGTNIGEVVFSGLLEDKVYQLVETKAPSGYSRPMGQWRLTADSSGNWTILGKGSVLPPAFADVSGKYILPNMKGKFFPLTGFGGILNYLIAGLGIMAAAAAGIVFLLFSQKRKIKINKLLLKKEVEGGTDKRFKETCDN